MLVIVPTPDPCSPSTPSKNRDFLMFAGVQKGNNGLKMVHELREPEALIVKTIK